MRYLFIEIRQKQLKERLEENHRQMRQTLYKALSSTVKTPKDLKLQNLEPVLYEFNPVYNDLTLWYNGKK